MERSILLSVIYTFKWLEKIDGPYEKFIFPRLITKRMEYRTFTTVPLDKAKELLQEGLDPNIQDSEGMSLLRRVIQYRDIPRTRLLLDHGAHLEGALTQACLLGIKNAPSSLEIIDMLLEKGANPNERIENSDPPLFWTVLYNNTPASLRLLEAGANVKYSSNRFPTMNLLHYATSHDNIILMEELYRRGIPPLPDGRGKSLLSLANSDQARELISQWKIGTYFNLVTK